MRQKDLQAPLRNKRMKAVWIILLSAIVIMLGSVILGSGKLFLFFLAEGDWLFALIFAAICAFSLWAAVKIFILSRTEKPTDLVAVAEEEGYVIHAVNRWTDEERKLVIPYESIQLLLIGVWTNPSFSGRKRDYAGAKIIARYTTDDGSTDAISSIVLDEAAIEQWKKRILDYQLPAFITHRNISTLLADQHDEVDTALEEAIPFTSELSVREFVEQKGELISWKAIKK